VKVTFVGPVPPLPGGIAQHSARVIEALRTCGADVTVLSWASQYPPVIYKGQKRDPGAAPFPGARFLLRWWDPTSWVRAGRVAKQSDLLVMPWVTPVHAVPQRTIAATAKVPVSYLVHNAIPHERMPFDEKLASASMRRAAQIVVHAQAVADAVHELAPGVPVSIVPHPPQLPIDPRPLPARPPLRLLCLGLIRHYKGFDIAVEAVRVLRNRGLDVELTIAGEMWDDIEEWERRIAAPDLGGCVNLQARYLADDEMGTLLGAHHMLLAPYRSATQSGVLSLAFAAHRPVVATDVGGLRESIEEQGGGAVVPPNDPEALADAIVKVADDLEGASMRAGATSWTWEDVARALLQGA
jgi:glycosyltransferase involved in cell wall biosynthesis